MEVSGVHQAEGAEGEVWGEPGSGRTGGQPHPTTHTPRPSRRRPVTVHSPPPSLCLNCGVHSPGSELAGRQAACPSRPGTLLWQISTHLGLLTAQLQKVLEAPHLEWDSWELLPFPASGGTPYSLASVSLRSASMEMPLSPPGPRAAPAECLLRSHQRRRQRSQREERRHPGPRLCGAEWADTVSPGRRCWADRDARLLANMQLGLPRDSRRRSPPRRPPRAGVPPAGPTLLHLLAQTLRPKARLPEPAMDVRRYVSRADSLNQRWGRGACVPAAVGWPGPSRPAGTWSGGAVALMRSLESWSSRGERGVWGPSGRRQQRWSDPPPQLPNPASVASSLV